MKNFKSVTIYLAAFFAAIFLGMCQSEAAPQSQRPYLSVVIKKIQAQFGTPIAYSPSMVSDAKAATEELGETISSSLDKVLKNSGFGWKQIGSSYVIYKLPPPPKPAVKPIPEPEPVPETEPEPDTVALYRAVINLDTVNFTKSDVRIPGVTGKIKSRETVRRYPLNWTPKLAVKTNLLYDAMTSIDLGVEMKVRDKMTLNLSLTGNGWEFNDGRKLKHIIFQPELRRWNCTAFSGAFWGVEVHGGYYDAGGMLPWGFRNGKMFGAIKNDTIDQNRFEGWLAGAGITYGYHWILGNRLSLEAELGLGYTYLGYDRYDRAKNASLGSGHANWFGPTKASISLVYIIK
jgi:hypothetical protein